MALLVFPDVDSSTKNETDYYGPYNTLLGDLFLHGAHFEVTPYFEHPIYPGSAGFTILYIVQRQKCPVLCIQIKPFTHLHTHSTREKADAQMCERLFSLVDHLVTPKLYGISVMGTCLAIYEYSKKMNLLTPPVIAPDPEDTDIAPADPWAYELLEEAGEAKVKELVASIKAMCANIACVLYLSRSFSMSF
ncbi:hypothetical protein SCLCIDRAFT_142639 [Scleroderma citrinum Foug A]|uniref:Fungal-type protein kinase domain-containing protein n=1 Tax=Scleroderma citrinum Foug A TaxID=1036808 RepID=A0A0C2ZFS3_9AGAM|nr:hypothetical protein SCLCIDRAFT_142639 [Scleroderma citrinum Foug A]